MSRVLAIANVKGGVGKTTTTANLAAALVERGHRVLAVDLDPQASLTFSLGISTEGSTKTISDALDGRHSTLAPILQPTPEHIDVVPANRRLNEVAQRLDNIHAGITLLRGALEPLRDRYDYILIDCPANAGILTGEALTAADEVVIPLIPDSLSVQALSWLLFIIDQVRTAANPTLRVAGVLLTMYDPRTRHAREVIETVHQMYGSKVLFYNTVIKYSVRLQEAVTAGKSILAFAPDSPAANAYRVMAEEIEKGIHETPTNELHFTLLRGYEALREKDLQTAYAAFCRATDINPTLSQAWLRRGECAPAWDEAVRAFVRALELEPALPAAQAGLEQSLKEKVSSATPADIPQIIDAACSLKGTDLTRYAEQLYRRVTELDARNAEGWLGLVRTASNPVDVIARIRRRLELDPDNSAAQAALEAAQDRLKQDAQRLVDEGQALLKRDQRVEARARFERAIELDPHNTNAAAGRQQIDDGWRTTAKLVGQASETNPENGKARAVYPVSWDSDEAESRFVDWRELSRLLVPLLIIVVSVALLLIKLTIR